MRLSEAEWRALCPSELLPKRSERGAQRQAKESRGEQLFAWQLAAAGIPAPVREYVFAASLKRKWRFDFCWPVFKVAVEIEGLLFRTHGKQSYLSGRHASRIGFHEDCVKYHTANVLGWTVERWTHDAVKRGIALAATHEILRSRGLRAPLID